MYEVFTMETYEKQIQKIKDILEKEHGREFTLEEATDAFRFIETLARISLKAGEEEFKKQKLLKENPKGFHYDGERGKCEICSETALGENSWYDKYGLKCMTCQNSVNQKTIPGAIAKDNKSWYSSHDLQSLFNIGRKELKEYIKTGFLKERLIRTAENKIHLQLFLLRDNKDVLPPKKLVSGKIIKVDRDGEEFFTHARWYECLDVKSYERLKKYKIVECFPETFSKPIIDHGRFYWKGMNPIFTHMQ